MEKVIRMSFRTVIVSALLAFALQAGAQYYDFTATAPGGQTLYCMISGENVTLVNPFSTEGRPGSNHVSGDLVIPDSVRYIQDIDTLTLAVTSMYYSAFRYCDSLTSVVLPNTMTNIAYCAFGDCYNLVSVTIGNAVTSIGAWAFSGCFALRALSVPESVTSIGSGAFNALRYVEYYGSAAGAPWNAVAMNGYKEGDFAYADSARNYLLAYIGSGGDVSVPSPARK